MTDNRWRTGNRDVDTWTSMQHADGKHSQNCPDNCRAASRRSPVAAANAAHRGESPRRDSVRKVRTPLGNTVTADLEQLVWRWLTEDVLPAAEAATWRRRAEAHRRSMSRPTDNQVVDTDDWPTVTRPGRDLDPDQQRIRDLRNAVAVWGYLQLAEHPELRACLGRNLTKITN